MSYFLFLLVCYFSAVTCSTDFSGKLPTPYTPPMVDESQPESDCETGQEYSTSEIEADLTQDSIETDESVDIEPNSPIAFNQDTAHPDMLHGTSSCQEVESEELDIDVQPRDDQSTLNIASKEVSDKVSETTMDNQPEPEKETAPAQEITSAQQESTLVRSALRSSLDGEDAELLNNFLTKARAKRAAKAVMAQENVEEEKVTKKEEVPDMPTPRSRRALEELDTNSPSPSPQKVRLPSPKKPENPPASPIRKEIVYNDKEHTGDEKQQSSPVTRRSTRVRVPPRTTTSAIRNTLSLRRAKGNEFVFLQRSEAQELALVTRKNTRQNKGSAVFPKYVLKNLAQKQGPKEGSPNPAPSANKKGNRVCWNNARLVEFEDGEEPQPAPTECESSHEPSDVDSAQPTKKGSEKRKTTGGSSGRTRSQRAQKDNKTTPSTGTLAPPKTTATPPAGRVRKLGGSATPTKSKSAPSPATPSKGTTDTPAGKRKKLTPKSPSSTLSPAKNTTSSSTTTTPASKVPKPTSRTSTSSATKSKSIFKANAGSTPMPKRVRARA